MFLGTTFVAAAIAEGGTPSWISPVAALFGTIVGGAITFYTTTVANRQAQEAERERQRVALIRDISIRFIQAVSKQSIESLNLNRLSTDIKDALQKVSLFSAQGGDPGEVVAALQKAGLTLPGVPQSDQTAPLDMAIAMMESIGGAQAGMTETSVLLAEMRLLLPNRILDIAATVTTVAIVQQLTAALPLGKKIEPGHLNQVLNLFTNAVRKEMGLDKYTLPENLGIKDLAQKIKDLEAAEAQ
jgi:hypothetical protein